LVYLSQNASTSPGHSPGKSQNNPWLTRTCKRYGIMTEEMRMRYMVEVTEIRVWYASAQAKHAENLFATPGASSRLPNNQIDMYNFSWLQIICHKDPWQLKSNLGLAKW
jgi:hypothetical protein